MSSPALRRVAEVLEQVLTDFGRRAAEDPRRLRGLLTDTLGAEAPELQEAIETLVAAAESGLPQAALASGGQVDRAELISSLSDRIPAPEVAGQVVDAWMTALRIQDQIPTDGRTEIPPPEDGGDLLAPTEVPPEQSLDAPIRGISGRPGSQGGEQGGLTEKVTALMRQRRPMVLASSVVLLLALAGVGVAAMRPNSVPEPTTTTTSSPSTTALPTTTTTTTVPIQLSLAFTEETTEWGVINRVWDLDGAELRVTLEVTAEDEGTSLSVYDVIPPSLGVVTDDIVFVDPEDLPRTYRNESAMRFILDLAEDETETIQYLISLDEEPENEDFLELLRTEWYEAMEVFQALPPPEVTVAWEADDDVVTIKGETAPENAVSILGETIEAGDDGSFEHTLPLGEGMNLITGRVVDMVTGKATAFEVEVEYMQPTTTTQATNPTSPPPTSPPPTQPPPTTTSTTTTSTTTTQPPGSPPELNCSSSQTLNLSAGFQWWHVKVAKHCFTDSEGNQVSPLATQPSIGSITTPPASDDCGTGWWCWRHWPPDPWDGNCYQTSVNVYAENQHGRSSTMTINLNVGC